VEDDILTKRGHLLDSQVREVEAAVRMAGLPQEDFQWMGQDGGWAGSHHDRVPAFVYKPAAFFICFEYHEPLSDPMGMYNDPGGHQVLFKPGRETPKEHLRNLAWQAVLGAHWEWLRCVARERGLPFTDCPSEPGDQPVHQETSTALRGLVGKLGVTEERDFLDEAIKCHEARAYRAAIIMVWILTVDHLQEFIFKHQPTAFNRELAKVNDKRVKVAKVTSKDDFGDIPESKLIELARAAGIINNDVRKILDAKLGIRNSYAHPSNVSLSPVKAAEFITDLVDNVILKYPL